MYLLKDLEPKEVFRFFESICDLPHGSKNTKLLSDFCAVFARMRGLWCQQDKAGNIIIRKEASKGYEDHPTVILQGHLDMVCEKLPEVKIDFQKDGLTLKLDGDRLHADGTTLGGDDGIAVAMALAILDDKNLVHPPLEVLFTVDEEIGMLGATALDGKALKGRTLINIDSEDEGFLTAGCAGGVRSTLTLPVRRESARGIPCTLSLDGLIGGHSGTEINAGHENAVLWLAKFFAPLARDGGYRLSAMSGGGKDNAIPRAATVKFLAPTVPDETFNARMETALAALHESEPNATLTLETGAACDTGVFTRETAEKAFTLFETLPNGVIAMSEDVPGLVETSLNLGILATERSLVFDYAVRSSKDSAKRDLTARLKSAIQKAGGQYQERGAYPAWEYRADSRLRNVMVEVFRAQYGYDPKIDIIHAGLECGILSSKLPGLDCISMGPDLYDIHTPRESLSVSSVERTWKYLLEVLKAL